MAVPMSSQIPARNGADVLCDTLLANDVDVCFANPGTSEMHFVSALDRQPRMRCVLGLFEGVVTGAADGYARMAGKPAATLLHLGPGLANGLANLHNARRAGSPIVNIVGDHASYHLAYDSPLTSDIRSVAGSVSAWVRSIDSTAEVSIDAAEAVGAARDKGGQVVTLILPANVSWTEATDPTIALTPPAVSQEICSKKIAEAAAALRRGKASLLLISGAALRGNALEIAARITQATGARLLAQQSNGRMERGVGRVAIDRVPFSVDLGVADLAGVEHVVLVGAKAPVAFFAYPNKPSSLLPEGCKVTPLAAPGDDLENALAALADALRVRADAPVIVESGRRPDLTEGRLTATAVMTIIGRYLPEESIVCDESVSSGRDFFALTRGAARHDYLQITGGAIGMGLPVGVGAAIACPGRKVVCVQADGSAMYTLQALWTQARERLDVTTVILANRSYAILHGELKNVGAGEAGHNARRMLDLDDPALNWVRLAQGMGVDAVSVASTNELADALKIAMRQTGPFLIEAVM